MMTTTTEPALTPTERARLGERVRLLRLEQRLDQRGLARRAGVALGTLQMIERGAGRDVQLPNVEKVAIQLKTTVADLLQVRLVQWAGRFNREDAMIAEFF